MNGIDDTDLEKRLNVRLCNAAAIRTFALAAAEEKFGKDRVTRVTRDLADQCEEAVRRVIYMKLEMMPRTAKTIGGR